MAAQAQPTFYVIGHVKNPGEYSCPERLTVTQALAIAGGITETGSTRQIVIKRKADGNVIEIEARLNTLVQPNDMIYVPPRQ